MAMQTAVLGPLPGSVDSTARMALGTVAQDEFGNEYIYLGGVAATVLGDTVVYSPTTFLTTRSVAASRGPVAVATAAVLAGQFGWYQIFGNGSALAAAAVAINTALYVTATAGAVDDAVVATQRVEGMYALAAAAGAGAVSVRIQYPFAAGLG